MSAVLIKDGTGNEIIFLDNGTEVHKAGNRTIKVRNDFVAKGYAREFPYPDDKTFIEAWNCWLKLTSSSTSLERNPDSTFTKAPVPVKKPAKKKVEVATKIVPEKKPVKKKIIQKTIDQILEDEKK